MEKISLNGEWRMVGNGYDCTGSIPGSVYSFLLGNKLKDDPYYRENEWDYLELMNHDYVFSRRFDFERKSDDRKILLLCEGLDTLAEIKLNGKFVSATKNMHRTYEFDVSVTSISNEFKVERNIDAAFFNDSLNSPSSIALSSASDQRLYSFAVFKRFSFPLSFMR